MVELGPRGARKWLERWVKGSVHEVEGMSMEGLRVELAENGLIRCNLIIPQHLSDDNGNWHPGAMAILIDNVAAAAVWSAGGTVKATVDFNISYYSPAKIQEEVVIEAKVVGAKGKLMSSVVDIKKQENGEMVALGRLWISTFLPKHSPVSSKL